MAHLDDFFSFCKERSAYEVAEDLQTAAESLGQNDEGWKQLAEVMRHANSHVSIVGYFPRSEKGELG